LAFIGGIVLFYPGFLCQPVGAWYLQSQKAGAGSTAEEITGRRTRFIF
jgi:UPF0716 family protein affecting phage T7 exclusion